MALRKCLDVLEEIDKKIEAHISKFKKQKEAHKRDAWSAIITNDTPSAIARLERVSECSAVLVGLNLAHTAVLQSKVYEQHERVNQIADDLITTKKCSDFETCDSCTLTDDQCNASHPE
jgi:hypothetical protein